MKLYGRKRALTGYVLTAILALFLAGCGGGGGGEAPPPDDTGGTPPPNDNGGTPPPDNNGGTPPPIETNVGVKVTARPGSIIAVEVNGVTTLDDSQDSYSTPQGKPLSYAWSFTYKPDGSNAVLTGADTVAPSFTADKAGSYMVELLLSAESALTQRTVWLVEAHEPGAVQITGKFDHTNWKSNCGLCHYGKLVAPSTGHIIPGKSPDHLATSNMCQACHTTFGFEIYNYVDHMEVLGSCSECHNNVIAVGKAADHVETTVECDNCHNTRNFLSLNDDGTYDHSNIGNRACTTCHTGILAKGKNEGHIETDSDCGICHSTTSFVPAVTFDHTGITDNCTGSGCHGDIAIGQPQGHPDTKTLDCGLCHNTLDFNLGGNYNHRVLDSVTLPCVTCHDGNHVEAGARGVTDTQIHSDVILAGTDCGACHNTVDFTQWFVDHTKDPVTDGRRCDSCHNNTVEIGMPSPNHVATTEDCVVCHTPGGTFATGVFDHSAVDADPTILCSSCHNDVITAGQSVNHIPTADDCRQCHNTTSFAGATVDHTNITDGCSTCHDGVIATGKKDNHVPTTAECNVCHVTSAFKPASNFAHQNQVIAQGCVSCHNGRFTTVDNQIQGKPAVHIPSQDDCGDCHKTTDSSFAAGVFDHSNTTRGCEGCHNGRFTTAAGDVKGKPDGHIPTAQDCYLCHATNAWTPSSFAHTGITGNCVSCHDGNYTAFNALGKNTGHVSTSADCGACHSVAAGSFTGGYVNHTSSAVTDFACESCHSPTGGATPKNPGHLVTSRDCKDCHVPGGTFVPAVFDHSTVTRATRCDSCHVDGDPNITGKDDKTNPPHVTTSEDCRVCHNTDTFAGAKFNHDGITGNCASCHNGTTAIGKDNFHVPTNLDCVECHTTTGFIPGTFDHAKNQIVDKCESCHDGTYATGKTANHVDTIQDCGVCHNTTTFVGGTFDHSNITAATRCDSCHVDGDPTITGKDDKTNGPHLTTTRDCRDCHTTATFVGGTFDHQGIGSVTCDSCHNNTANAVAPGKPNGHFGTTADCDYCHSTSGWAPTIFDHNDKTLFPNYPGDHRGDPPCSSCHGNTVVSPFVWPSPAYQPYCAACHEGNFRRKSAHHGGTNGTVEQNKNCGESGCHRVTSSGF